MPTTLDDITQWLLTTGLHIVPVMVFAVITTRLIRWLAGRISQRLTKRGNVYYSSNWESAKHKLSLDLSAALGSIKVEWVDS